VRPTASFRAARRPAAPAVFGRADPILGHEGAVQVAPVREACLCSDVLNGQVGHDQLLGGSSQASPKAKSEAFLGQLDAGLGLH